MNASPSSVSDTSDCRSRWPSRASSPGRSASTSTGRRSTSSGAASTATASRPREVLETTSLKMTGDPADLRGCTFFVVAVPTPVDANNVPDLTPVERASETVGRALGPGAVVVFESTVYPGVTEDVCGPILEKASGLRRGVGLQARLLAGAHQPGRQGAHPGAHHQGGERRGRAHPRARRRRLRGHHRRRSAPGAEHQGGRSGQGHREHPARSQHRAHERARHHLRPDGHPHRRRPRRGRHQVELPRVQAGPRRRALHRRRPVLPDHEGAAARLPAGGHPGRAAASTTAWGPTSPRSSSSCSSTRTSP